MSAEHKKTFSRRRNSTNQTPLTTIWGHIGQSSNELTGFFSILLVRFAPVCQRCISRLPWQGTKPLEFIAYAPKNDPAASACLATNQHSLPTPGMPGVSNFSKVSLMGVSYLGCITRTEHISDLGRIRPVVEFHHQRPRIATKLSRCRDSVGCITAIQSRLNSITATN